MSNELISKAMILAAGRGQRMGALTEQTPKPLLQVQHQPLIAYHLEKLAKVGIQNVVINLGYLGEQIRDYCGQGERWGLQIDYSDEGDEPIGTASGIKRALPKLGDSPFLVIAADIFTDYPLAQCHAYASVPLAHVILVPNPSHHPRGDFSLSSDKILGCDEPCFTYAAMGIYHPKLFRETHDHGDCLGALLRKACRHGQISAEIYRGQWLDVGTSQRLAKAHAYSGGAICST